MKKVIFAAVVLFSMTTFAVNPKNINPVKEKLEIESTKSIVKTGQKLLVRYYVKCYNGDTANVSGSFDQACAKASALCGEGQWTMYGNN